MEGILFLLVGCKNRFDLGFFLKWGGFHGQSRQGPAGGASIDHAYHRYSRRWDRWFGPVWNWCQLRLGVPIRMARCAGDTSIAIDLGCWLLQGDSIRVWCWWRCLHTDTVQNWCRCRLGVLIRMARYAGNTSIIWVAGRCGGIASGSGAGGGAHIWTCCGVQSHGGSGHGLGCCGFLTNGRGGGMVMAGNGLLAETKGCRFRG